MLHHVTVIPLFLAEMEIGKKIKINNKTKTVGVDKMSLRRWNMQAKSGECRAVLVESTNVGGKV